MRAHGFISRERTLYIAGVVAFFEKEMTAEKQDEPPFYVKEECLISNTIGIIIIIIIGKRVELRGYGAVKAH